MDNKQIKLLRENVIRYYEEFLTTERFIHDFESFGGQHIDVLMITERYVSRNANKLNKNSFIIRGTHSQNNFPWKTLLQAFRIKT